VEVRAEAAAGAADVADRLALGDAAAADGEAGLVGVRGREAAAMVTQRVRLGALITPLARRRPWKFARETASLDQLSNGRLILGVGVGGGQEQFGDLGDEPNQRMRGEMLDEGLAVVTGLWGGETFAFEGRHYHLKPAVFRPKPVQHPHIPIWVAGTWPHKRPLARMARWDSTSPPMLLPALLGGSNPSTLSAVAAPFGRSSTCVNASLRVRWVGTSP